MQPLWRKPSWHAVKLHHHSNRIPAIAWHNLAREMILCINEGYRQCTGSPKSSAASVCQPEEVAAVGGPVLLGNVLNGEQALTIFPALVLLCQDGQPGQHSPEAVLLPDMVTPRAKGLLSTDRALACKVTRLTVNQWSFLYAKHLPHTGTGCAQHCHSCTRHGPCMYRKLHF